MCVGVRAACGVVFVMEFSRIRQVDGRFCWAVDGVEYRTDERGCGLWVYGRHGYDEQASWRQIEGTAQFVLDQVSASGRRGYVKRYFERHFEDGGLAGADMSDVDWDDFRLQMERGMALAARLADEEWGV